MGKPLHHDYPSLAPKPEVIHRVISDEEASRITRLIIVGDVHGCLEELQELLVKCDYDQSRGDRVILLGDLVNKGPFSAETVKFAREKGFLSVRGNHDDFALCHTLALIPPSNDDSLSFTKQFTRYIWC